MSLQVGVRAGLAQEYVKVSREQAKVCESHILDQHLQHQVRTAQSAHTDTGMMML